MNASLQSISLTDKSARGTETNLCMPWKPSKSEKTENAHNETHNLKKIFGRKKIRYTVSELMKLDCSNPLDSQRAENFLQSIATKLMSRETPSSRIQNFWTER